MSDTEIRAGVVGTGFWANSVHMAAYRDHPQARVLGVCDVEIERARSAARTFGAEFVTRDYMELVTRDDIDVVNVVTPNVVHAPVALAALEAGKHVMCEKPLAMSYSEAEQLARAAAEAGVKTGINFTYRGHPAARFARHLVEQGQIGRIFHVNAFYMQGWLVNPEVPMVWRLRKEMTGTGALGDLGSHIVDLVEWLTGERIVSLVSDMQTFVEDRPLADGSGTGRVDVDDGATFLTRFGNGAMGTFVSSRYGTARPNYQRIEIYGDKGALVYSWEDTDNIQAAVGPVSVRESQMLSIPVPQRFKPTRRGAADRFGTTQNMQHFVEAILEDKEMVPNFRDGLRNQEVLEAVAISSQDRGWVTLPLAKRASTG